MTEFLHWLVSSSLVACLVLPWVFFLTAFSQRAPSAWLAILLAAGIVAPACAPLIDRVVPGWIVVIPALESTGLYEREQDVRAVAINGEPLPPSATEAVTERRREHWWEVAIAIWALGAAAMVLGKVWHMLRERLRLGRGSPLALDDPLRAEWEQVARLAGLRRVPWMMSHRGIRSAMISGIVNPVLVVPEDFPAQAPAARAMILRHEAEHLVRKDLPRRLCLELLGAVFWFHPLFPLALKRYDLEVEKACDDAVLRQGHAAHGYAGLLLAEARRHRTNGRQLKARIKALLSRERSRGWTGPKHLPAGYLLLFAVLMLPAFAVKFRPWADARAFRPITPRDAVAAWWRCNTGHGNAVEDWSGHGLHGRIYGARWVKDAERGPCLSFDGIDDVLALPAAPDTQWTTGPFTVAMWLKPRAGSDGGGLLLRGEPNGAWSGAIVHEFSGKYVQYGEREFMLAGDIKEIHRGYRLPGMWPGYDLFTIISMPVKQDVPCERWTHLAMTMSGDNDRTFFRCYLNGKLAGEESFASSLQHNQDWPTAWWWFGRGEAPPVHGNYYEGRLSDLVVLRKTLDEAGITALMQDRMPE